MPAVDRMLWRYGEGVIASVSFDKGPTPETDQQLLELFVRVVMPKRGKMSAVKSANGSLENRGLNWSLDLGLDGYWCQVGYGVLAYNLHLLRRELLRHKRARADALARAA